MDGVYYTYPENVKLEMDTYEEPRTIRKHLLPNTGFQHQQMHDYEQKPISSLRCSLVKKQLFQTNQEEKAPLPVIPSDTCKPDSLSLYKPEPEPDKHTVTERVNMQAIFTAVSGVCSVLCLVALCVLICLQTVQARQDQTEQNTNVPRKLVVDWLSRNVSDEFLARLSEMLSVFEPLQSENDSLECSNAALRPSERADTTESANPLHELVKLRRLSLSLMLDFVKTKKELIMTLNSSANKVVSNVGNLSNETRHLYGQFSAIVRKRATLLWFSKSYKLDWISAEDHCVAMGGHLVTIDSRSKSDFVQDLAKKNNVTKHWIGLRQKDAHSTSDCRVSEYWSWVSTNSAPSYVEWLTNEPNGCAPNERIAYKCVESLYYATVYRGWNDVSCSFMLSFVCEVPSELLFV